MKIQKNSKIYFNGELMKVIATEFVNPGKMQSFTRVVLKGLLNDVLVKHTFKPKDPIVFADDIEEVVAYFSYQDQDSLIFIEENAQSERTPRYIPVSCGALEKDRLSLLQHACNEHIVCTLLLQNDVVIKVDLPLQLNVQVKLADVVNAHDKVVQGAKNARITSGHTIRVPSFIEANDVVTVTTADLKYIAIVRKEK